MFALYNSTVTLPILAQVILSSGDSTAHNVAIFHCPEPIAHPVTPGRSGSMSVFTSVWSGLRFAY